MQQRLGSEGGQKIRSKWTRDMGIKEGNRYSGLLWNVKIDLEGSPLHLRRDMALGQTKTQGKFEDTSEK